MPRLTVTNVSSLYKSDENPIAVAEKKRALRKQLKDGMSKLMAVDPERLEVIFSSDYDLEYKVVNAESRLIPENYSSGQVQLLPSLIKKILEEASEVDPAPPVKAYNLFMMNHTSSKHLR